MIPNQERTLVSLLSIIQLISQSPQVRRPLQTCYYNNCKSNILKLHLIFPFLSVSVQFQTNGEKPKFHDWLDRINYCVTLPCDIQKFRPANWPIESLEINMRYNYIIWQIKQHYVRTSWVRGLYILSEGRLLRSYIYCCPSWNMANICKRYLQRSNVIQMYKN